MKGSVSQLIHTEMILEQVMQALQVTSTLLVASPKMFVSESLIKEAVWRQL